VRSKSFTNDLYMQIQISTLMHTTRFWNNIHQVRSKSKKTGNPKCAWEQ